MSQEKRRLNSEEALSHWHKSGSSRLRLAPHPSPLASRLSPSLVCFSRTGFVDEPRTRILFSSLSQQHPVPRLSVGCSFGTRQGSDESERPAKVRYALSNCTISSSSRFIVRVARLVRSFFPLGTSCFSCHPCLQQGGSALFSVAMDLPVVASAIIATGEW